MFSTIRKLLEMIRFSHTLFALPFALLAALLAWNAAVPEGQALSFRWIELAGILLCMVGARSAAMAFNRWADRAIDAANPRTAGRHLPAGELSVQTVVWFTLASAVLFLAGTGLFWPNWLPLAVSLPVLGVLLGYSYAKRFTSLAHFWLGFALMLAPICAWLAIRGLIVVAQPLDLIPAVVLGMAVLFWVAGFDMIYACQDYEYDKRVKLNSIPVRLGIAGALRLAACCHLLMMLCLLALPLLENLGTPRLPLGWIYWLTLLVIGGLLIYEHALVRPDDLTRVNQAFFSVNVWISLLLLLASGIDLWLLR